MILKMIKSFLLTFFCSSLCITSFAQHVVTVKNGSFEGEVGEGNIPTSWLACGEDSTPDVLPGPWGVYSRATEGVTYMGLITRDNGTWETAGQLLDKPLKKNECYSFKISLALSAAYAGYNKPVRFRIWGGHKLGEKKQLLVQSDLVNHYEWKVYNLVFFTNDTYESILLEPYYDTPNKPYRGNLLFDGMSNFTTCIRA